jgi:hypothetical protein
MVGVDAMPAGAWAVRFEIERLVHSWCHHLDQAEYPQLLALFTDQGRYVFEGRWDIRGQAALKAWYDKRKTEDRVSRHCATNLRLTLRSEGVASATGIVTVYRHIGADIGSTIPAAVLDLEDRYQLGVDGRWRIAEHRLIEVFTRVEPTK